ncbi:UPF0481 protein [Platanthera guangdongensis]|uniref:UPF0481 protein n=1 Tax=Platanthera guangdongensis TaxID=2320717 RepID=A0ABR2MRM2_9ASPA
MDELNATWAARLETEAEQLRVAGEEEQWRSPSIYRVPHFIRETIDTKGRVFQPQVVSFGPFHHGDCKLKPMEPHKERAVLHLLRRTKTPLMNLLRAVEAEEKRLLESYGGLGRWREGGDEFVRMMTMDGCFMLELLRVHRREGEADYGPSDPVFGINGSLSLMPYMRRDILMIENQLPLFLLRTLLCVIGDRHRNGDESSSATIRSATRLHECGIRFRPSPSSSFNDIRFDEGSGDLFLPPVIVDDATECEFLNMVAFEHLHAGSGNGVSAFVQLMGKIIDVEKDVDVLHRRGVLGNALGGDRNLAELFNNLAKEITIGDDERLREVEAKVSRYCRRRRNRWCTHLRQYYFRSPWTVLSIAAAAFAILLSLLQTIYTVWGFYHQKAYCVPPPPPPPPGTRQTAPPSFWKKQGSASPALLVDLWSRARPLP